VRRCRASRASATPRRGFRVALVAQIPSLSAITRATLARSVLRCGLLDKFGSNLEGQSPKFACQNACAVLTGPQCRRVSYIEQAHRYLIQWRGLASRLFERD